MITRDMTFKELLIRVPEAAAILGSYGLHCIGCRISAVESIEEGARAHGLSDDDIDKIISQINDLKK